jgi:hypothetical protein
MERTQQFKTWPARYKAWHIDVYESERFQNWLTVSDVRWVVHSLRNDTVLLKEYPLGQSLIRKGEDLLVGTIRVVSSLDNS